MSISIIEKEMGYSKEAFFKQFKTFAQNLKYSIQDLQVILQDGMNKDGDCKQIVLTITEKKNRQLGALMLPSLAVKVEFENFSSEEQILFLHQFDRSFQRGGG